MLVFICLIAFEIAFSQQIVRGIIADEKGANLSSVMIINISTDKKVFSNSLGEFAIEVSKNDELRFILEGYERLSKRITTGESNSLLSITLYKFIKEIEEVKLYKRLTGNLSKDSKTLSKVDKKDIIQKAIGLTQPVGKMREKPAEIKKVLLPILTGNLDIQGVYDLISGKARKQKQAYRYDDLQDDITWIRSRVEDDYFVKTGIPKNRISEFLEFSFYEKPQLRAYIKAKNLSGAVLELEDLFPLYLDRLKNG
ncbi:carboxypeptidase regulatory-like domain-containing protein [Chryseobacterium tructae]|uniref:Carboxypeptidase regulatory-like domain-containing protein n=1 Tax=Chryseobacterium tructae TaxID=1037380 RepID=A0ABV7XY48_9FLAO|nr:carboxypeptidase regulatory-like domain-containing protein [Chryseobacterium tructae]MDN3692513.1 carboxypeptidase regulatory-like domain-containing protein [Chryseobacterium tructae]